MSVKYASLHAAVVITTGDNDVIRLDEAGVIANATIAAGTYYLRGDGTAGDLCKAVQDALDAAFAGGNTYAVTVTSNGSTSSWDLDPANRSAKVCIALAAGAINFRVKWSDASATFSRTILGFQNTKAAANTSAEVGTLTPTCVWVPNDACRERRRGRRWTVSEMETADGDTDVIRRGEKVRRDLLQYRFIDERRVFIEANAADPTQAFESFLDSFHDGRPLELHERAITSGTLLEACSDDTVVPVGLTWRLGEQAASLDPTRIEPGLAIFDFDLELVGAES